MHAMRRWWFGSGVLMACIGAIGIAACARPAPEQALRDTIARVQQAVEARDAGAIEDALAEDFIGPDGMDRKDAWRLAQVVFLRNRDIGATLGPLDIRLEGESARVRFTAAMTGGRGVVLPDEAQVFDVTTGWRMRGGDWELVNAEWSPRL